MECLIPRMPLPFSFSTQRQNSEGQSPIEPMPAAVPETMMNLAPGFVSTEPLPGTAGNPFPLPAAGMAPRPIPVHPRDTHLFAGNQAFAAEQEVDQAMTAAVSSPSSSARPNAAKTAAAGNDLSAQIDQLRNDIFGIAMNVSALSDRLDRLEQRIPSACQSTQAGIATLRAEVETWLESHLGAAVEHCMHQIIQRTNAAATQGQTVN